MSALLVYVNSTVNSLFSNDTVVHFLIAAVSVEMF